MKRKIQQERNGGVGEARYAGRDEFINRLSVEKEVGLVKIDSEIAQGVRVIQKIDLVNAIIKVQDQADNDNAEKH
jgi:hypothetical protein